MFTGALAGLTSGWAWLSSTKWARDLAIGAGLLLSLFLGFNVYTDKVRKGERRKIEAKQAVESAKEQVAVAETRIEITETRSVEIREAEQAADDHVVSRSVDELRKSDPALAAIVYGPAAGRGGETKGR